MTIRIYTDGAVKKNSVGWGFVALGRKRKSDIILFENYGEVTGEPGLLKQRNVAGEIEAVMQAINWAYNNYYKSIVIFHDYEGCAAWPLGLWKAKNE